jgi:5-methylcytosine-specific restriction protein B
MNSADKSISLIDTALRRRFDFVEVIPRAEFIENVTLRNIMKKLNESLVSELDSTDLLIGHSYFMGKTEADICNIMNRNIIPLLYEYFYDNSKKVKALVETVTNGLGVAIKKEAMGRIKLEKQD